MSEVVADLRLGDCRDVLPTLPSDSVDLIFTSPPYADSRARSYGGIAPDQYAEWFLPISAQLLRILKPEGTFVLNIKEKVVGGERHIDQFFLERVFDGLALVALILLLSLLVKPPEWDREADIAANVRLIELIATVTFVGVAVAIAVLLLRHELATRIFVFMARALPARLNRFATGAFAAFVNGLSSMRRPGVVLDRPTFADLARTQNDPASLPLQRAT